MRRIVLAGALLLFVVGVAWGGWLDDAVKNAGENLGKRSVNDSASGIYDGAKGTGKDAVKGTGKPAGNQPVAVNPDGSGSAPASKPDAGKADAGASREAGQQSGGSERQGQGGSAGGGETAATGEVYSPRFDFVPGEKTLYFDDFSDTSPGDFPARWTIVAGGGQMEVVESQGRNWLKAISDGAKEMKNSVAFLRVDLKKKLPQKFTVEFDIPRSAHVSVSFSNSFWATGQPYLSIAPSEVNSWKTSNRGFPSSEKPIRHVSIAVSDTNLKAYFDGQRVLLDPDFRRADYEVRTVGIQFRPDQQSGTGSGKSREDLMFTNFRLAEGGKDYGKELVDIGRIVTHGITFDSRSDVLKPESGPTLRKILKLLQDNADLKFEIQGHTDSQGGDKVNGPLSERRANAVKTWLVGQGIEDSRLSTKGLGATKPIDSNETSEGRANNRRVEFVKF
jgi:OOP family OmpA-OmpF porin